MFLQMDTPLSYIYLPHFRFGKANDQLSLINLIFARGSMVGRFQEKVREILTIGISKELVVAQLPADFANIIVITTDPSQ